MVGSRFLVPRSSFEALSLGLVTLALLACDSQATTPSAESAEPPHRSFDAIVSRPVQGKLGGQAFEARDARYLIDRRPGYEQLDLKLSAATADTPCGTLEPADAPSVWLRRAGAESAAAGEHRLKQGEAGSWEVHYQIRRDGRWRGKGDAAALLRLRPARAGTMLRGELAACFGDGQQSCVAGTFEARLCPSRLDMPPRGSEPVEQLPDDTSALERGSPRPGGTASSAAEVSDGGS